jgi:Cu/Ag efflux protein CusF
MTRRVFTASLMTAGAIFAQDKNAQDKKKTYTFRGKIESIDASSKSMSINGEKVDGWMAAMTMIYPVENADVFKTAKVGDTIEATVYDGDYTLHDVRVVKSEAKKK